MKYTHEIVGTHEGALLPERAPGAKPLVYSGLKAFIDTLSLILMKLRVFIHRGCRGGGGGDGWKTNYTTLYMRFVSFLIILIHLSTIILFRVVRKF